MGLFRRIPCAASSRSGQHPSRCRIMCSFAQKSSSLASQAVRSHDINWYRKQFENWAPPEISLYGVGCKRPRTDRLDKRPFDASIQPHAQPRIDRKRLRRRHGTRIGECKRPRFGDATQLEVAAIRVVALIEQVGDEPE